MAEQDDPSVVGNIMLGIQQAMMQARTVTVGRVVAYRETGPHRAGVVDVQVAPEMMARTVKGSAPESKPLAVNRDIPVAAWEAGEFTIRTPLRKGQHVLLIICDRELESWVLGDGEGYRPTRPGQHHNLNDAVAFPFLTPEKFQSTVRPSARELFIGDRTGNLCSLTMDAGTGAITLKSTTTVSVEAPSVTIGDGAESAPIARTGIDLVVVPPGGAGGTFLISPGSNPPVLPVPIAGPPSAHIVKG